MKTLISVVFISLLFGSHVNAAPAHPCVSDAHKKALKLLNFHYDETKSGAIQEGRTKTLKSLKNPAGKGRFDVIQVWGAVYKAEYRMRMIYSHGSECILQGQEILEWAINYR